MAIQQGGESMLTRHLDLTDPNFIANPYPTLADLRENAPIFYDDGWDRIFFTRYEDIATLLKDRRLGRNILSVMSRDELGWTPPDPALKPYNDFQNNHILEMDPPDHTRLRNLFGKAFTPRRVESLRGRIEQIVDHWLDRAEPHGGMDLKRDFAEPLPVTVIAELLGVPEEERPYLRPWSDAIVKMYEPSHTEEQARQAVRAVNEFSACVRRLATERRANPGDDLISDLAHVEDQGQRLTEQELISNCILLLNAGHEASVNGTTLGFWALCRHPEQKASLTAAAATGDTSLFKTAIDEMLRYESPLPMFNRWVFETLEYKGHQLKQGAQVTFLYLSGNRDPRRFERADELDLARQDNLHLTFGLGAHYCIGAPLARLEMQIAFRKLLQRFPNIRMAHEEAEFSPGFVIRGLKTLPVVF